jgi:hypothetical protein
LPNDRHANVVPITQFQFFADVVVAKRNRINGQCCMVPNAETITKMKLQSDLEDMPSRWHGDAREGIREGGESKRRIVGAGKDEQGIEGGERRPGA